MIKQVKELSECLGDYGEIIKVDDFLKLLKPLLKTNNISFFVPELNTDVISTNEAIKLVVSLNDEAKALQDERHAAKRLEMLKTAGRY